MREEVIERKFADVLDRLSFDEEVLAWVRSALRASHADEKQEHEAAIARLQDEYNRLQGRVDTMYVDKLDGRIDAAYFDRMAAQWRDEQGRCLRDIVLAGSRRRPPKCEYLKQLMAKFPAVNNREFVRTASKRQPVLPRRGHPPTRTGAVGSPPVRSAGGARQALLA